ncbi:SUKH-3 domain-containing protein [Streptomyces sp. NBC_01803]|uniref:SUKH-3 domain-containing protein n=1 Tax=Streptomyces sp. NBC_01803 TaxID=2975946 RepID=UPI002DDB933D|nr:SUKH-3 domain-containing protein [Streptomyces sp. NBC_01803]WSA44580.1 SUKH-3 domain-containing protein [Streptomyces sp. NBC_01803]
MISDTHGPVPPVLRHRRDGILPTTAAALSVPARAQALTGTASRAAAAPDLHPVVADILDGLGTGQRERHLGRCPEPFLLSRCLTEAAAHDLTAARIALADAGITTRHIREDGDPQHGEYAPHCRSCAVLLARLGVRSVSAAPDVAVAMSADAPAAGGPWSAGSADQALTAGGWSPGRRHAARAERWADVLSGHRSPQGHPHTLFPAAFETWAELGALTLSPQGPGQAYAATGVVIDPLRGLHWARTLGELGRALGTELCPLGEEAGGTALLVVDRDGRLYCVDHTGDWYLGPDVLSGLTTLLTGAAPHRLVAAAAAF